MKPSTAILRDDDPPDQTYTCCARRKGESILEGVRLKLPYPPTANSRITPLLINGNARLVKSKNARDYNLLVGHRVEESRLLAIMSELEQDQFIFRGDVEIEVVLHFKDRRKRDIDNPIKSLLDALVDNNLLEDDSQVARLVVSRGELDPDKKGYCMVEITLIKEDIT